MVPSYTVEVSYSFYVDQQGKNVQLHVTDWMIFGNQLADGLALWAKLIKLTSPSRLDINGDINKADR